YNCDNLIFFFISYFSTLTLGILKRRYLAHVGCESLNPEARNVMKQVVKEELVKMQVYELSIPHSLYVEVCSFTIEFCCSIVNNEMLSFLVWLMIESEDKEECETGSEEEAQMKSESEDAEQEVKNSKRIKNGNRKPQINSEDSSDEDVNKSEKKGNESDCDNSPKEMVIKRANATKTGETRSSNTSQGKTAQSDEENETDTDSKSEKSEKSNDSSDDSEKGDYANMILQGDKAVVRLKRYISLCGLRPNYKKLLDGCRSVRSQVAVLKKELEELGVHGQPSVKKCKIVRLKREETQELAELDVSNIIHKRTLNTPTTIHDSTKNKRGIISDDADSN
uniref:HIRA interacting protein 3 n=1 Tax=Sander lucioperca TaxID=283035 RepID=A0A8D0CX98_SANLU